MTCRCGEPLLQTDRFCPSCGRRIYRGRGYGASAAVFAGSIVALLLFAGNLWAEVVCVVVGLLTFEGFIRWGFGMRRP